MEKKLLKLLVNLHQKTKIQIYKLEKKGGCGHEKDNNYFNRFSRFDFYGKF